MFYLTLTKKLNVYLKTKSYNKMKLSTAKLITDHEENNITSLIPY